MDILISVDFDILCQIFSHFMLTVLSEDHLCEFVLSRIERDESQVQLLESVRFEFISSEILSKVLSYPEQVSPTINCAIWNQIILRFKLIIAALTTIPLKIMNGSNFLRGRGSYSWRPRPLLNVYLPNLIISAWNELILDLATQYLTSPENHSFEPNCPAINFQMTFDHMESHSGLATRFRIDIGEK
jgi:hypothetical protein